MTRSSVDTENPFDVSDKSTWPPADGKVLYQLKTNLYDFMDPSISPGHCFCGEGTASWWNAWGVQKWRKTP